MIYRPNGISYGSVQWSGKDDPLCVYLSTTFFGDEGISAATEAKESRHGDADHAPLCSNLGHHGDFGHCSIHMGGD